MARTLANRATLTPAATKPVEAPEMPYNGAWESNAPNLGPRSERPARLPARDLFAGMNGTERSRAIQLEAQKRDGQIRDWRFEAVTLKLAPDCRYTPDLYVLHNDGSVEFEEVKGFWREDAKVKIRVAARLFPEFRFRALRLVRGSFEVEEYRAA